MPEKTSYQVCLVSMPMALVHAPSAGMGIVHAAIEKEGLSARSFHLVHDFISWIGIPDYLQLIRRNNFLMEWLFRDRRNDTADTSDRDFYECVLESSGLEREPFDKVWERVLHVRDMIPRFVDASASKILSGQPRIVGCSSTFQQVNASLALLREVKRRDPSVTTMMGGANCEYPMGIVIHRRHPFVDYVVMGEADLVAGPLAKEILLSPDHGRSARRAPGVLGPGDRDADGVDENPPSGTGRSTLVNLKEAPFPDYKDFFADLQQWEFRNLVVPSIPVELSRGCWWAAKEPCTFCGLNLEGVPYRMRPVETFLEDLKIKIRSSSVNNVTFVDNVFNPAIAGSLAAGLESIGEDIALFMEIRADTSKAVLEELARVGYYVMNPGIESFSDEILTLANKGVDAVTNVAFLKWCRQLGIIAGYNLLYGFPGETPEKYRSMCRLIDKIMHLPCASLGPVKFERYSRYFREPEKFGLRLVPCPEYALIHDIPDPDLTDLAYHFVSADPDSSGAKDRKRFIEKVDEWNRAWSDKNPPRLDVSAVEEELYRIGDTRPMAVEREHIIGRYEFDVLDFLDTPRTKEEIEGRFGSPPDRIEACLEDLLERHFVLHLSNKYLSLVLMPPFREEPEKPRYAHGVFLPELFL